MFQIGRPIRETTMLEKVDKALLAGLGALSMTREQAGKIFDSLVRRGQAARGERVGFVKGLMDAAHKGRKDLEEVVARQVRRAVAGVGIPSRQDLERLEKKLDHVLRRKAKRT
jgi:polyhydroxyalkanoate synthesis regulator phasin